MLRTITFATVLCGLALMGQSTSMAATPSLTGSWQLTFTPSPSPVPPVTPSYPGLATFTKDGSTIETDGMELVPGPSSTVGGVTYGSPGHGIWQPAPAVPTLYVEYVSLVVNADGSLDGKNVTTMTGVTLATTAKPETFKGTYTTTFTSVSGVSRTVSGNVTGVLIPHPVLP